MAHEHLIVFSERAIELATHKYGNPLRKRFSTLHMVQAMQEITGTQFTQKQTHESLAADSDVVHDPGDMLPWQARKYATPTPTTAMAAATNSPVPSMQGGKFKIVGTVTGRSGTAPACFEDVPKDRNPALPQSESRERGDLVPAQAMLQVMRILKTGAATHGDESWKKIPKRTHVGRAAVHLFYWLSGDTTENHLGNAICRLMFALEQEGTPDPDQETLWHKNNNAN